MPRNNNANTAGQGNQNRPAQPKSNLQVYPIVVLGPNNTYEVLVNVRAFFDNLPLAGLEAVLRSGASVKRKTLDQNGECLLRLAGAQTNSIQDIDGVVSISGSIVANNFTVRIPAIPTIPVKPKLIQVVAANISADTVAGTYAADFLVTVFEDGLPMANQSVSLLEGVAQINIGNTDAYGRIMFPVAGNLQNLGRTIPYRICLVGFTDNVEQNLTVPALDPKQPVDNDPVVLILHRHHDGNGNFSIIARVLKEYGYGVKTRVTFEYMGNLYRVATNRVGEAIFRVPGIVLPGEHNKLRAWVDGIEEERSFDIKVRETLVQVPAFSSAWWLGTNNGRACILMLALFVAWFICLRIGVGDSVFSHNLMANKETGLSAVEQYQNQYLAIADSTKMFKPDMDAQASVGRFAYWGWMIVITIMVVFYFIFAWREEVGAWLEGVIEKLFDRDHSSAGDPTLEKLGKILGSHHVIRKTPKVVLQTVNPTATGADPNATQPGDTIHRPSTMFKMDLISDSIVAIMGAILKRFFHL